MRIKINLAKKDANKIIINYAVRPNIRKMNSASMLGTECSDSSEYLPCTLPVLNKVNEQSREGAYSNSTHF